ncbi:hypothetical protein K8R30_04425 [archaeon]|nr:hypothetical protein [archaeon]
MKGKREMKIIPKVRLHKFNQVSVSIVDINPKTKIKKKRYSFSKTTSNC